MMDLINCAHPARLPTNIVLTLLLPLLPLSYLIQTRHTLRRPSDTTCSIWHVFLHSVFSSLQLAVVISQHVSGSPVFGCRDFWENVSADLERVGGEGTGRTMELWTFGLGLALPVAQWVGAGLWCYAHIHRELKMDAPVTMDHIVEQLGARKTYKSRWLFTLFSLFLITLLLPMVAFSQLTPLAPLAAFVPLATIIAVAQAIPEVISMRQNRCSGGLSRVYLEMQAVLFVILAVGWGLSAGPFQPTKVVGCRYQTVRWFFGGGGVALNWGVNGLVQAVLLAMGIWFDRREKSVRLQEGHMKGDEETSLLQQHDEVED